MVKRTVADSRANSRDVCSGTCHSPVDGFTFISNMENGGDIPTTYNNVYTCDEMK
jgi:hypothetical protein